MPVLFTQLFAERLGQLSKVKVRLAKEGDIVESGTAYVAPGGEHLLVKKHGGDISLTLSKLPATLHIPSVDVTFSSVAKECGGRAIGVLLTGMGADGAKGLKEIKQAEGKTIAQDQASCVIFGMPKAAIDMGAADKVTPLSQIASEVMNMV
jgi:two-component system chemotaxis response regulator CheB